MLNQLNQDLIKPGRSLARNIRLTTRNQSLCETRFFRGVPFLPKASPYLFGIIWWDKKPVPGARLVLSIFSEIRYDKRVT